MLDGVIDTDRKQRNIQSLTTANLTKTPLLPVGIPPTTLSKATRAEATGATRTPMPTPAGRAKARAAKAVGNTRTLRMAMLLAPGRDQTPRTTLEEASPRNPSVAYKTFGGYALSRPGKPASAVRASSPRPLALRSIVFSFGSFRPTVLRADLAMPSRTGPRSHSRVLVGPAAIPMPRPARRLRTPPGV